MLVLLCRLMLVLPWCAQGHQVQALVCCVKAGKAQQQGERNDEGENQHVPARAQNPEQHGDRPRAEVWVMRFTRIRES